MDEQQQYNAFAYAAAGNYSYDNTAYTQYSQHQTVPNVTYVQNASAPQMHTAAQPAGSFLPQSGYVAFPMGVPASTGTAMVAQYHTALLPQFPAQTGASDSPNASAPIANSPLMPPTEHKAGLKKAPRGKGKLDAAPNIDPEGKRVKQETQHALETGASKTRVAWSDKLVTKMLEYIFGVEGNGDKMGHYSEFEGQGTNQNTALSKVSRPSHLESSADAYSSRPRNR